MWSTSPSASKFVTRSASVTQDKYGEFCAFSIQLTVKDELSEGIAVIDNILDCMSILST